MPPQAAAGFMPQRHRLHVCCRKRVVARCTATAAPAAQPGAQQQQRQRKQLVTLPNVSYSTSKADITLPELRRLYATVHAAHDLAGSSASSVQSSFFQHWQQLADEEAEHKLQQLLDRSVAVVAVFTRDPHLYASPLEGSEAADSSSGASTSGRERPGAGGSPSWNPFPWRQRLPRRLVGFVRAAGDAALVATIHDLLVHPELQGFGLGSVLLRRLLSQIRAQGVYDIGLVSPAVLQSFFHSCSFEPDREASVPMALQRAQAKEPGAIGAPLQANPALHKLLQTALDNEQRALFTRLRC